VVQLALSNRACPHLPSDRRLGRNWLHEIKHDGFRIMARRDGAGVRLFTRNGHDFTARFPLAAGGARCTARPLVPDRRRGDCLEGEDLRRAPIEHRKLKLSRLVRTPHPGIVLNDHYDGDGEIVFEHACKLGCAQQAAAGQKQSPGRNRGFSFRPGKRCRPRAYRFNWRSAIRCRDG
jgi:ATP-dependent DNA ligase